MLVFAALSPHTPLLVPTIGKDNLETISQTTEAMDTLAEELYLARPDTIILISGHSKHYKDAFSIQMSDQYKTDLSQMGDLSTDKVYQPDFSLIDTLQRSLRTAEIPFTLHPEDVLDYGVSVPLQILSEKLDKIKIVPISTSSLSPKEHFAFGKALQDTIFNSTKRIAVIASGDLSHALTNESPAGFHKDGEKFDKKIQELVATNNAAGLIKIKPETVEAAAQCCYRALLILFGVLDKQNINTKILNYQAPLGVGYLTVKFNL